MTQIEIPSELPSILRNFTLSVLRSKPHDIIDYAADYFIQLQRQRQQSQLMTVDNTLTTVPLSSLSATSHYAEQQTTNLNALPAGQSPERLKRKSITFDFVSPRSIDVFYIRTNRSICDVDIR